MITTEASSERTAPVPEWPSRSFLGSLPHRLRTELLSLGRHRPLPPGHVLVREGDDTTHALLIRSGSAKVTALTENGRESLLDIRAGGDIVGETAAVDGAPRPATVRTCGPVTASIVHQADLRRFLTRRPEAAVALVRVMADRLRWADRRRLEFRGYPTRIRVARVLVELAAVHGRKTPQGLAVAVTLTQSELAALTGSAEVTVHKALRELRREGLLATGYRRPVVLDLERLRAAARLPSGRT